MSRQDQIWRDMQALLPEVEPDRLADMLNTIMQGYEAERLMSRDTIPTKPQMLEALHGIRGNLQAIAKRFTEDDGLMIAGWLGAELDQADASSASFMKQTVDLLQATERAIGNIENSDHVIVDDKPHTRKTRTGARDQYLIPMLTGMLIQLTVDPDQFADELDPLDPSKDHDFLDTACSFITLALEYAGIPAPAAGNDVERRGEEAQGRLRRAIKDAARHLTNSGIKPTP